MQKTSFFSAVVFLTLAAFSQVAADTLEIVTLQYPPYEYEENGKTKGIAVDLVRAAFKKIEQPVSISVMPWIRALIMIEKGNVDAIFTAFKTPEREKFADYSKEVLMPQEVSLFALKDSKVTFDGDLSKLYGYLVGMVRKVSYGKKFDDFARENKEVKLYVIKTGELNMNMLLIKRIDILISNRHGAYFILSNMGRTEEVEELKPVVESVPSYIAFSKKRNLAAVRDKFDKALAGIKAQGEYDRIIAEFYENLKKENSRNKAVPAKE